MEHLVPLLSSYGAPRVVERHVMMQGRSFYQPFPEGHVLEGDGCMAFTPQGSSSLVPLALCGAAEGSEYEHPSVPKGSDRLLSWLEESRDWTPLHHIEALSKTRTRALLDAGANVHAAPSPSPLERARELGDSLMYQRVQIHGLSGAAELNGRFGVVVGFDEAKGRYAVRIEESQHEILEILKKPEHAVYPPASGMHSACHAASACVSAIDDIGCRWSSRVS